MYLSISTRSGLMSVTRGVYLLNYHNHFVSTAHNDDDLNRTFDIVNEAFKALGDSAQHQVA